MKITERKIDINDFDKCIFCKSNVRVSQLKNMKSKRTSIVKNDILFCCCFKCKERYLVEIAGKLVRVYKVSDLINGKIK